MLPVQRAIQIVQRLQGDVHPLLLQIALHLLLSLRKFLCGKLRRCRLTRLSNLGGAVVSPAGNRGFVFAVRAAAAGSPAATLLPPSTDRGTAVS